MWILIIGSLILGAFLGIIYLASRFSRFSVIRKAAKDRRLFRYLFGILITVLLTLALRAGFDTINTAICILHLTVIWILCDIVSRIAEKRRGERFKKYYAGVFALGITAVYLACGWYLAHHVWRTAYTLETEKEVGTLRIVQFADSHIGSTFDGEGFLKHVESMQAEHPDIVVVTGDFVDDDTSREDMVSACAALGTLETTYGVYYAFGNHDKGYYGPDYRGYSGADLIAELEKNHVIVLQDETVLLDNRFYLIGRQDRSQGGRASMEALTAELDPGKYSIVLDHQPYEYEEQADAGVDLVLSGHTHGGQLFPFHRMGEWMGLDARIYGMEQRGDTSFIVTSGISDWTIQFKTGCRSEYVVVDIVGS